MEGLSRLAGDLDLLRRSWERETVVSTALGDFDDVLTVAALEAIVAGGLPLPAARLFRDGEFLAAAPMARPKARRGRNAAQLTWGPGVFAQIRRGATLAVEELQLYSPAVARLTDAVAAETGWTVDSTAFLTPARAQGAGPHRDQVSFFLRQVAGTKRWRVWPAEAGPVAGRPAPREVAETVEPEIDVLLKEGDCIYIPRNRVHLGETFDEPSVHLSIGMWTRTWGEALAEALRAGSALADGTPGLGDLLPPAFLGAPSAGELRDRVAGATTRLAGAGWADLDPDRSRGIPTGPGLQAALDRQDGP